MVKKVTAYKTITKKVPKLTPEKAEAIAKYSNTNGGKMTTKNRKK